MIKYLSVKCKKYKIKILKTLVDNGIDTLTNTIYAICDENQIEILIKELNKVIIIDTKEEIVNDNNKNI